MENKCNTQAQPMENPVMEAILTRRSVRKFKEEPVPKECLAALAQAAIYAPSGRGLQTWQITVVDQRALIDQLAKAIEEVLDRPGYDMYRPAAIIIPSNERNSIYGKEDDACALEIFSWRPIPWASARSGSTSFRTSATTRASARCWIR